MTLCIHCRHFLRKGPRWYLQLCGATPREPGIDPVTGEEGFVEANDLGQRFITQERFAYARDVNTTGQCGLFEAKESRP
jgi:hypothetical protein